MEFIGQLILVLLMTTLLGKSLPASTAPGHRSALIGDPAGIGSFGLDPP